MITADDDRFHPRSADLYWNESAYIAVPMPQHGMHGFVYIYHRPNMNLSAGGVAFWDQTGDEIHDCLYWNLTPYSPMRPGTDMFDVSLDNGLRIEPIELLHSYAFSYKSDDCSVDLRFESDEDPYDMQRIGGEINPSMQGLWTDDESRVLSTGHYDQTGRIRGTVTVEGQTYEVANPTIRDRTWGPRKLHPMRVTWDWGISASDRTAFSASSCSSHPPATDPFLDTTEPVLGGWYRKDGVRSLLVSGTRTVLERDGNGRPLRLVIEGVDELGRDMHAEGTMKVPLNWTGYGDWFCHFDQTYWELDGEVAVGELEEMFTFAMNRRLRTSLRG